MIDVTLPLFVLSGIGGDERLFEAQRAVRDIRPIAWIPAAHARETLGQYAERLAAQLHIHEPFDLGGSSFGGMVALEIARHLAPQNVFLFGSCRSPRSIAPSLRALRLIAPMLPDRLLHPPVLLQRPVAWWFGATSAAHAELFADMLASTPSEFMRWASNAVASWKGVAQLSVPIHHVHGERDRLIPCRRVRADRVIAGAGHLLNVTHADAVNDFIASADRLRAANVSSSEEQRRQQR
jgi:pimeloyl-ACP methyl ester carboxylesterase